MALTEYQKEYLLRCNHRWNVKTGATGSGKSFVDYAVVIPKRILACRGDGLIVLIGNTQTTLERNILAPMRSIWGETLVGMINSKNTVRLFGHTCYAIGADKKSQVAKIQGATIEYAYGDEVTTWSVEVFQMLKSRLRCEHSRFDGTCNPDNPLHWFKEFLDSDADIYQQSYTIDDGCLPANIVAELKKEYAGTVYYQRFILGLWAAAEGAIYRQFADDPERYIVDQPPEGIMYASIGVDFGGNGSATAFICNGITRGYKQICTLDEHYFKGFQSPAELEQDFVSFVQRCKARYPVYAVYCDSAEQTLIQGLQAAAVKNRLGVDIDNAEKGSIIDRIRFYCALMGTDRYKVMRSCTHLIEAFTTAVWSPKELTKDVRLDDGSRNIDSLDALEYSTESIQEDMIQLQIR